MRNDNEDGAGEMRVNTGYGRFRIARALVTVEMSDDPAARMRAWEKVKKWTRVLVGMSDGSIRMGSRLPVEDAPAWATLEVITGGFATGALLAGGPLRDHELALLAQLPIPAKPQENVRRYLNSYFLTEEGLAELAAMVESGRYRVDVPEEGALPVVAWLVRNGYSGEALSLLDELEPLAGRLRFYPVPAGEPRRFDGRLFVQDVKTTLENIERIQPGRDILAQREAITVWAPLYDRMIVFMLETVEGEPPRMACDADGRWHRHADGRFQVEGGWPCRHYPDQWKDRAGALLAEYASLRSVHTLCGRPDRAGDSFSQLREYLGRCAENPMALTGRDVGRIRLILARHITRQDVPGSPRSDAFRAAQQRQADVQLFGDLAKIMVSRLEFFPADAGIDDPEIVIHSVTADESARWGVRDGTEFPPSMRRKVERCANDTIEGLVERGLIASGEELARVLPRMTSVINAVSITDPSLRGLYEAIYAAFRRRRSLLLLNLEKQVQLGELPWIAAIDRFREDDGSVREMARQTLKDVAVLAITAFPYTIIPNKLLQEFNALAETAAITLPLVQEVAMDIFMGAFSPKFLASAKIAAVLLKGSLYESYYGIDYERILELSGEERKSSRQPGRKDDFMLLCEARAGVRYNHFVPTSGMIVEQQQVLTTQNLAVLYAGLDLAGALKGELYELARHCFIWICDRQVKTDQWHAGLIRIKDVAYAWRQMIFFLSLIPDQELKAFLSWAEWYFTQQPAAMQVRFRPALDGLLLAARGISLDGDIAASSGARRLLGWSDMLHWMAK